MDIKFVLYFVVPIVAIILITVLGLIFLALAARHKKKIGQIEIDDWATTGGKILSVDVNAQQADQIPSGSKQTSNVYEPHVEYTYVVNNVEYHGTKVFPDKSEGYTQEAAQKIIAKYPVNGYVPVRFNPQDPSDSALQTQSRRVNYLTMAGWVFTGFGVLSCCFTSFMAFIVLGAIK